jgi:hypothetical protein
LSRAIGKERVDALVARDVADEVVDDGDDRRAAAEALIERLLVERGVGERRREYESNEDAGQAHGVSPLA